MVLDRCIEIVMARRAGGTAFAVTTGTTSAEQWAKQPSSHRPHRVLSDLSQLIAMLER